MYLSESIVWPSDATALRQMCLQVLAHQAPQLLAYQNELNQTEYEWIRRPEVGMVMVHGRTEASGTPFAVGETTVSRCVLRLASGETGFGYVLGRDKLQAELISSPWSEEKTDAKPIDCRFSKPRCRCPSRVSHRLMRHE